jgi:F0F1-type ATP synthase alpha subunit
MESKISSIKAQLVESAKKAETENTKDIISILRANVKDFDFETAGEEVGTVISVGDGIATIHGLSSVMYGEIVIFDSGVKGKVQDIKRKTWLYPLWSGQ